MMLPSRLDCPLSLKTPNMGNPGEDRYSPHGSGQLKLMRDEPEITLRDYCRMMITISDNMATDLLMEAVGIPNINTFLDRLGCPNTRTSVTMGRYHYRMTYQDDLPTNRANDVLQAEASAAGANDYKSVSYSDSLENNVAAPAEMGGIMKRMYEGTLVSSDASSEMLEMMKNARELRMIRPHMVDGPGPPWDRTDGYALRVVPTGSEHPCARGISPGGSCASCCRIPSPQMLAGTSNISPNTVLFSMLLCPDLFRVSLGTVSRHLRVCQSRAAPHLSARCSGVACIGRSPSCPVPPVSYRSAG